MKKRLLPVLAALLVLPGCFECKDPELVPVTAGDIQVAVNPGERTMLTVMVCRKEGRAAAWGELSLRVVPAVGTGTLHLAVARHGTSHSSQHEASLEGLAALATESSMYIPEGNERPCDQLRAALRLSPDAPGPAALTVGATLHTGSSRTAERLSVEVLP